MLTNYFERCVINPNMIFPAACSGVMFTGSSVFFPSGIF